MSNLKFKGKTAVLNRFSRNIKRVRKKLKMNQEEFAEILNISKTTLSNYENKKSTINRDTLVSICSVLDDEMTAKLFEDL